MAGHAAVLRPDLGISWPVLGTFRISGGAALSPEFTALLVGLSLAGSAGIAEIVRSGIQAVPRGQWEAAGSLGLARGLAMRLVVLPQALRIMIPPLTSTYLSTTKNSSLAVAIGYPDLVSVSNTTMNQTGQAIEAIGIFMGIYLGLSLLTSAFMNWYNARVALVSR
jgi:general L-amino acid transport system permease protein